MPGLFDLTGRQGLYGSALLPTPAIGGACSGVLQLIEALLDLLKLLDTPLYLHSSYECVENLGDYSAISCIHPALQNIVGKLPELVLDGGEFRTASRAATSATLATLDAAAMALIRYIRVVRVTE